jgi:hypothetical protein
MRYRNTKHSNYDLHTSTITCAHLTPEGEIFASQLSYSAPADEIDVTNKKRKKERKNLSKIKIRNTGTSN